MAEHAKLRERLGIEAVRQLAEVLREVYPKFDLPGFEQDALDQLPKLELKARVSHLIDTLAKHLPDGFCETARLLEAAADVWPKMNEQAWSSYAVWPLIDYVSVYGLAYPQRAFVLLEKLTPLFTAEFAIRPFLQHHFDLTHQQMLRWTEHENDHVRRLASEGIRPRLPWAQQLPYLRNDPSPIWPILEKLKTDPSLYVRRSVANNLNDISKDHPESALSVCADWQQLSNAHIDWIIHRGLRTLVKTGHPDVYPLLGFSPLPKLSEAKLSLSVDKISLGETLDFSLELETTERQKLVLDYRVGFVRKDGKYSWKVFKWRTIETDKNAMVTINNRHAFRPLSTRQYYPGTHLIECVLNGQVVARNEFELSC